MLKELYNKLKYEFDKYILLIKNGNFYISINNDAYIMNNIFKYKIKESSNFIKTGFPIFCISKITKELDNLSINYLIIDKDITFKQKFKNNNYDKYIPKYNYELYLGRINNINNILKKNVNNNISSILDEIEGILCKISY